jgi:YidC/Oxa1 family membrane protein insertase
MDFGVGFLSNNVMLPILDFFYGIVPSYGLAIVALTLVIRFALYPLSAKSIRNMRQMRVAQPVMQQRVKEIQAKYQNDPAKQQQEMAEVYKQFGNPFAGCLPVIVQMPVLFALFATLRGSPFSNVPYNVNLQIFPQEQQQQIQPQAFATKPSNIFVADGVHYPISALLPGGTQLAVGQKTHIDLKTPAGKTFDEIEAEYPDVDLQPEWKVVKGENLIKLSPDGTVEAIAPGDVTIQGNIPGIAADKGFLFIKALGRVGVTGENGSINWDILGMILFFGLSLYVSQQISGGTPQSNDPNAQQQATVNKLTPLIFSGMFLFFPLPAGVLMYMSLANLFQMGQTFILNREPLPEHLQKIADAQAKTTRESIPFEPVKTVNVTATKVDEKKTAAKPASKPAAKAQSTKDATVTPKSSTKSSTAKPSTSKSTAPEIKKTNSAKPKNPPKREGNSGKEADKE